MCDVYLCAELSGKDSLSGGDHALARRHHLLEGHAFDVLAKAFRDDGVLHSSLLH